MTQLPIPVHVGSESPSWWDDTEMRQRQYGNDAAPSLQQQRRPTVASPTLKWETLGFEPRWIGFDTSDCVIALQPSVISGQGAHEYERFRQGAKSRGELALIIDPIGRPPDTRTRNVFSSADDSIHLGHVDSTISSQPLGRGTKVRIAADLANADTDLARRLLNCTPELPWRSLSLDGVTHTSLGWPRTEHHSPAQGTLEPILVTELDEPVVAAWVSPDGVERRYVVPAETPWTLLLPWLLEQALPEYVPGALRRARAQLASDPTLMTRRERAALDALTDLETDHAIRHADLTRQLAAAQTVATPVREGLLYGTGERLVDAVRHVLEAGGMAVVDLDAHLGGTKNADLLCSYGGRSRLVEVKAASGNAPERAYGDLVRHLREWNQPPGDIPVVGGALVLNHQHKTVPQERDPEPYSRPEFLTAQTEPVITTLELFAAWQEEDMDAIRKLLFPGTD